MTQQRDSVRLRHMLSHAEEAVAISAGRVRADLDTNRMLNLSLVWLLEIIGEAAARIDETTRQQIPTVPWPQIIGLRNRLIHGYDAVDFDILWDILQLDLPPLIADLRGVIGNKMQ